VIVVIRTKLTEIAQEVGAGIISGSSVKAALNDASPQQGRSVLIRAGISL